MWRRAQQRGLALLVLDLQVRVLQKSQLALRLAQKWLERRLQSHSSFLAWFLASFLS